MKKIITIILSLFFTQIACSSGGQSENTTFSSKNLAITVSGSRSFNPDIEHGQIDYYQITISAADLEDDYVERFAGDAGEAKMMGIPQGESRTILVEAYNPNGMVIRRGIKEGVTIQAGYFTDVEIVMYSVPIFTNITDNSAISGERFGFEIFGEPSSQIEIYDVGEEETQKIVDQNTGNALVDTSNTEGLFSLTPSDYDDDVYTFQVKDAKTGESSEVTVTLLSSTFRPGVGLNSGGTIFQTETEMICGNVGQITYRSLNDQSENLGLATLLEVMESVNDYD